MDAASSFPLFSNFKSKKKIGTCRKGKQKASTSIESQLIVGLFLIVGVTPLIALSLPVSA